MSKLIFISGVHGVGKSTLCKQINKFVDIPTHSCSDIIKSNSEYVETSKFVDKAEANQKALLFGLSQFKEQQLLLDGHFCLVGKNNDIIELSYQVFDDIGPSLIINVFADSKEIHRRLLSRDENALPLELIQKLQTQESNNVHEFAKSRNIPVFDYESGSDIEPLLQLLK
ncbi:ATP-binding protein [Vibrio sp. 10N.222.49.A3]|uniref:ATP-binding protein n=1 Tax=Vibrio TaxID=662 RepID=UPI000CC0DAD3|nr:ATP-binding protein [Vibrio splendidus]PMH07184.1 hypothetical protein BCU77_00765 [Vibrio splendidus]